MKKLRHACVALFILAIAIVPAFADDPYGQGCQLYKNGNYSAALNDFLRAEAAYPRNPVVHYQLANTYLQLHRRSEAKEEYSRCLSLRPDATTASYCQKMMDYLSGGGSSSNTPARAAISKGASDVPPPINDPLASRKEEIMRKAQEEANAIRADADRQIREMSDNTNQRIYNVQTGELATGISTAQSEQIKSEAEEKANRILEQARDKVEHMH